jgi:uncharacterized phage protein
MTPTPDPKEVCPRCEGSGWDTRVDNDCHACNGTGKVKQKMSDEEAQGSPAYYRQSECL